MRYSSIELATGPSGESCSPRPVLAIDPELVGGGGLPSLRRPAWSPSRPADADRVKTRLREWNRRKWQMCIRMPEQAPFLNGNNCHSAECSELHLPIPPCAWELRPTPQVLNRIADLAKEYTDEQIAEILSREGLHSNTVQAHSPASISPACGSPNTSPVTTIIYGGPAWSPAKGSWRRLVSVKKRSSSGDDPASCERSATAESVGCTTFPAQELLSQHPERRPAKPRTDN